MTRPPVTDRLGAILDFPIPVTAQGGESSAGRVGAKRRIEAKRLVEGAPVGGKRLVSIRYATQPALAPPRF